MDTPNSLSSLGDEYIRQGEELEKQIASLKGELPRLKGRELYRMRNKISRLQTIANDLTENGKYLKSYYEEETDD